MGLYSLYFGAISVLLPYFGLAFGLGTAVQGSLFPAEFAGFVPGVLLSGYLSDRWGRKSVLLVGIGAYTVGLFLFGIAPRFDLALLAAALIGGGSGALETVASALVADLYPERRAFVINALQVVFGIGAAIGPFLAQVLLSGGTDWRVLYIVVAIVNALLTAFLFVQVSPPRATEGEAIDFAALLKMLQRPVYQALCLAEGLYVGAEVGFASWMPTYFRSLPDGQRWEGIVVTVFWVAMIVGRMVVSPLIGRVSLMRLTIVLSLISMAFAFLALFFPSPLGVLFCVVGVGLGFSGIFGLIIAKGGDLYPQWAGSAFGGIVASGGIGGALLPWIIGFIATSPLGWHGAMFLVPLAMFGVGLIAFVVRRRT